MIKPHFRLRKPPFYPLNYGDQYIGERIHGLHEGEQVAQRDPQSFVEAQALISTAESVVESVGSGERV